MISRLLSRTSYAVVPSNEEDMAASHETKCRKEQDRSYASPLALVICALIIATLSAVGGLGIGLWMKGSKDALPSWTYSLSRGKHQKRLMVDQSRCSIQGLMKVFTSQWTSAGRSIPSTTTGHSPWHHQRIKAQKLRGMTWSLVSGQFAL